MPHPTEDDLALLALGEPVPHVAAHVSGCAVCDGEVRALRATVDTARRSDMLDLAAPPPAVWQRIADELGIAAEAGPSGEPAVARPDDVDVPLRRTPWRRPLAAAVAVLAAAAAVAGVLAVVRGPAPTTPTQVAAPLQALPGTSASGEFVLATGPGERSLAVDTSGLPPVDGFYEVWLLDLAQDRLVALGVLDERGRGRLTVPDGVRIEDYREVDVSVEPDDGDPTHSGASVLRGELPT